MKGETRAAIIGPVVCFSLIVRGCSSRDTNLFAGFCARILGLRRRAGSAASEFQEPPLPPRRESPAIPRGISRLEFSLVLENSQSLLLARARARAEKRALGIRDYDIAERENYCRQMVDVIARSFSFLEKELVGSSFISVL